MHGDRRVYSVPRFQHGTDPFIGHASRNGKIPIYRVFKNSNLRIAVCDCLALFNVTLLRATGYAMKGYILKQVLKYQELKFCMMFI